MIIPDALTDAEVITLRDVFRQAGLSERKIQDVMLLLSFKPPQVQVAFYHISTGKTQSRVAQLIGAPRQTVGYYINVNCNDIKGYLMTGISGN